MTKKFRYNKELIDKMHTANSPVVYGLNLGLGKTESIKQYITSCDSNIHILVIVNSISELQILSEDLPNAMQVWHSELPKSSSFDKIITKPVVGITKSKFFQLLVHGQEHILNHFDEFHYDEFTGLSPLTVNELIGNIIEVNEKLKRTKHSNYILGLIELFKHLIDEIQGKSYNDNTTYYMSFNESMVDRAQALLSDYYNIYSKNNLTLDTQIIIILKALGLQRTYMCRFTAKDGKPRYAIATYDDGLKTFIKGKKFLIMDATAYFNRPAYQYLDIPIDAQFASHEVIDYSTLSIHVHNISDTTPQDIRKGNVQALKNVFNNVERRDVETFLPKNAIDPTLKHFNIGSDILYYFFSGKDIGTNDLRDANTINVIAEQTYPKIYRTLYNHILLDIPLNKAQHPHKDKAELYLVGRNLAQLIGRSPIRKHLGENVDIHLYVIDKKFAYYVKEQHFKNCKIIVHREKPSAGAGPVTRPARPQKLANTVLTLIETRLANSENNTVCIQDILSGHYKNKKSAQRFLRKKKQTLVDLGTQHGYLYHKKRAQPPTYVKTQ